MEPLKGGGWGGGMVEDYYIIHRGLDVYVYIHADRAIEKFVNEAQGMKEYLLWKVWLETKKEEIK